MITREGGFRELSLYHSIEIVIINYFFEMINSSIVSFVLTAHFNFYMGQACYMIR